MQSQQAPAVILVTGASGLLGRAVLAAFECHEQFAAPRARIVGTVHSAAADGVRLVKVDLTDERQTEQLFHELKPTYVVHCAAEKRPDVAEHDPALAQRINADAPRRIASLCTTHGARMVYISTDYVFDGCKQSAYDSNDVPNPLNAYGMSKRAGEVAALEVGVSRTGTSTQNHVVVLRVPVLYGCAARNSDSAVNVLLDAASSVVGDAVVDNVQVRYPTLTSDVARVIVDIVCAGPRIAGGIYHFSAQEAYTKYQMCKLFAELQGLPTSRIKPLDSIPAQAVRRPGHIRLSCSALEQANIDVSHTPFCQWWKAHFDSSAKEPSQ